MYTVYVGSEGLVLKLTGRELIELLLYQNMDTDESASRPKPACINSRAPPQITQLQPKSIPVISLSVTV